MDEEPPPDTDVPPSAGRGREPYSGVDIKELPTWWRHAIEHFEARGLNAYRPARFTDGTLTRRVAAELEAELDVSITLRCKNASVGDDWTIRVDGDPVGTVGRHRSKEGHTVFETTANEFRTNIRDALGENR